jgi:hypothetical protein
MPSVESDYESDWVPARLLSTVGLRNEEERERRATSALLAILTAVPEFGKAFLQEFGAPKGVLATFAEVRLKDSEGRTHIPDGALVIKRGSVKWCALLEVKTGSSELESDQVGRYLDLARANGFDSVITISNRISADRRDHVVSVDRRKLKSVDLFHISWWRILTMAVIQHRFRGVSDPDQAWLLGELIHYLDSERSGASGFQGMGEAWVSVRDAASEQTLRVSDKGLAEVSSRWDQYTEYLALSLSQELGENVLPVRPKGSGPEERQTATMKELVADGTLSAGFKIPHAVGPLHVSADLRTKKVTTSVSISAPREGRPLTRIKWILRQLKDAPGSTRVDVRFANVKETSSMRLDQARENPEGLLAGSDAKREPRGFEIALALKMGLKRGNDAGSFARETRRQTAGFYRDIVQDLLDWNPQAPKLKTDADVAPPPEGPADVDAVSPPVDEIAVPSTQWSTFFKSHSTY